MISGTLKEPPMPTGSPRELTTPPPICRRTSPTAGCARRTSGSKSGRLIVVFQQRPHRLSVGPTSLAGAAIWLGGPSDAAIAAPNDTMTTSSFEQWVGSAGFMSGAGLREGNRHPSSAFDLAVQSLKRTMRRLWFLKPLGPHLGRPGCSPRTASDSATTRDLVVRASTH